MMSKDHAPQSYEQLLAFQIHLYIERTDQKTPFEFLELDIRYCFWLMLEFSYNSSIFGLLHSV